MRQAADIYCLAGLEGRRHKYLMCICSAENIRERLLQNTRCKSFEKLKKGYHEFLVRNDDQVKMTKGWEDTFLGMKNKLPEVLEYQSQRSLEISKLASGGSS